MKPFVKYPGGKSKEIPLVIRYMPDNINRYVEPFVGGGSIYLALGIQASCINDISVDLINLYRYIKEQNEEFHNILTDLDQAWRAVENNDFINAIREFEFINVNEFERIYNSSLRRKNASLDKFREKGIVISQDDVVETELTARKTALYTVVRNLYNGNLNTVTRTAYYYFLREYCYSSMFRFSSTGAFNVPYGGMSYNSKYMTNKIELMYSKETAEYMENTEIYNQDFETFLNGLNLQENDFIFLDPPYDSDFSTYDQNPFDRAEQERLRDYLLNTPAQWMLIIKETDFIRNLYANFHIYEYDMNYLVSFKNRNAKGVKHLLITNYQIDEE